MYSRTFKKAPEKIVEKGSAKFGTYQDVSPKLDIRGMHAPYAGVPVPSFISNLRIKSRLEYAFSLDNYIGIAIFYDFKAIGLGEIIFWNKETGKRNAYHTIMAPRRRFVPIHTTKGICACYRNSRYLKISWGRNHEHHALSFKVKGDKRRPNAKGFLFSPIDDKNHCDVSFVSPSPSFSRCSASWISTMSLNGQISLRNKKQKEQISANSKGLGMMVLNRTYIKMHSKSTYIYGMQKIKNDDVYFYLRSSNLDAADSDSYNDNVLFVNNEPTALPPVYITHPFGMKKRWIIQDTESMVDLAFTPVSLAPRTLNLIALRMDYHLIYGTFEGTLLTKDGKKIALKNFSGILYKNLLRL